MAKPFKTLDEQIELLKNRNLIISDHEKAKSYLLEHSYYNVINVSSKFFKQQGSDLYIEGTTFEEIRAVHIYDSELKSIIFKNILTAEKHLKSSLAYRFGEKFKDITYAYLRTETYGDNNLLDTSKTISNLSSVIRSHLRTSYRNSIKHYYNNHNDIPMWVLINELSLGQTYYLFKNLDNQLKNMIARDLNRFLEDNVSIQTTLEASTLEKYLINLKDIRNSVAHDNVIFHYKAPNNMIYMSELHDEFGITPSEPKQNVFNTLLYLQTMLTNNQYSIMLNTIKKRSKTLESKLTTIRIDKIYNSLGFPVDFHLLEPRNQDK